MPSAQTYIAKKIFTGIEWLYDHAIVVEKGMIKQLSRASALGKEADKITFDDEFIVPAFIDLQIYGAHEQLLAAYPTPNALERLNDYCRKGGAAWFLPTVATNKPEIFIQCIDAIRKYWNDGGKGVLGLHIEGPWLNAEKRGAHPQEYIHAPSVNEVKELLTYGKDVIKMITLAPEVCTTEIIQLIRSHDIIVAAGHSNATYSEALQGFDAGISCVTHLYNAMSPLQHREPGLVGAALNYDKIMASIIPDGYHVDYAAIRIAKSIMKDRLYAITDAVTETTEGVYQHHLDGDRYTSKGILSGSALTMIKALRNLVNHVGIDLDESLRMCSLYPAKVARLDHRLGQIAEGYEAALLVLDESLSVVKVID